MKLKRMVKSVLRRIKRIDSEDGTEILSVKRPRSKKRTRASYGVRAGIIVRRDEDGFFKNIVGLVYKAASEGKTELVLVVEGPDLNEKESQDELCEKLVEKIPDIFKEIFIEGRAIKLSKSSCYRIRVGLAWTLKKKQ